MFKSKKPSKTSGQENGALSWRRDLPQLLQSENMPILELRSEPWRGATTYAKPSQRHEQKDLTCPLVNQKGEFISAEDHEQGDLHDDWLLKEQQGQHDELVQSVATEQKRANQATQRALDALSRLARRESQLQFLNKTLEENISHQQDLERSLNEEQEKRLETKARAEQHVAKLHTHIQHLDESLQKMTIRSLKAEQSVKQRDIQVQELTESLQTIEEERNGAIRKYEAAQLSLRSFENELQEVKQQQQETTRQLQETTQQLHDIEQCLQQANERADQQQENATTAERRLQQANQHAEQQQERATIAETRLQHSDQMFQDIFQRLIGQLPQSQPHWVIQRNEIELSDDKLGYGAWATVKVAIFRGNRVAAKCLHRQIVSAHNVRLFTREMNMAANARHPNLLQFIGATLDDQEPIIMTELMPTSLRHVMESGTRLTRPQVICVSHQVALALNYLHLTQPNAIIHRDVSSSNVLLELHQSSWKAKLSDYGSANFVRHTTTAGPGNPTYAAPEASNPEQQSAKMDMFSFGVLLVEMCSGELAPAEHRNRLIADIQWPAMVALVQQCLRHEPQRRPDMTTAIALLDQM